MIAEPPSPRVEEYVSAASVTSIVGVKVTDGGIT